MSDTEPVKRSGLKTVVFGALSCAKELTLIGKDAVVGAVTNVKIQTPIRHMTPEERIARLKAEQAELNRKLHKLTGK